VYVFLSSALQCGATSSRCLCGFDMLVADELVAYTTQRQVCVL